MAAPQCIHGTDCSVACASLLLLFSPQHICDWTSRNTADFSLQGCGHQHDSPRVMSCLKSEFEGQRHLFLAKHSRIVHFIQVMRVKVPLCGCPQGESRIAEVSAARLIDDIGWSTPMAPTRSAAAAATLDSPRDVPAGQATGSISMSQLHWLPGQSPSEWADLDWSLRQPLSGHILLLGVLRSCCSLLLSCRT